MIELLHNPWFLVFLGVIICSVTATVAQAWQKVRRGQQETELKLEMLHRGLNVDEMERLLRGSKVREDADEQVVVDLVEALGGCGASPAIIEQVLSAARDADPAVRQTIYRAVQAVIENSEADVKDAQILAVVRGLSRPQDAPAASEDVPAEPPVAEPKVEETFQLTRPA